MIGFNKLLNSNKQSSVTKTSLLIPDADKDPEPEYRNVTINTNQKVNELYNIEERLGT